MRGVERARALGRNVTYKVARGQAGQEIVRAAIEGQFDAIFMSLRGRLPARRHHRLRLQHPLRPGERALPGHPRLRAQVDPGAGRAGRIGQEPLSPRVPAPSAQCDPRGRATGPPPAGAGDVVWIRRFCSSVRRSTGASATRSPASRPCMISANGSWTGPRVTSRHTNAPLVLRTATRSLPSSRTRAWTGMLLTFASSLTTISTWAVCPGRRAGRRSSRLTLVV